MAGTEADRLDGQSVALAEVLASLYPELRWIAAAQMSRADPGSTLQPTALVHEAWLRLSGSHRAQWRDQSAFVAAAAATMRHILIDRARRRGAARHGAGSQRIALIALTSPHSLRTTAVFSPSMQRSENSHCIIRRRPR